MFNILGLKAWPSKWFTAIKVLLSDAAIAFAMLNPTVKHTINPGPAVAAIPSTSSILILLSFKAFFIMKSIFSTCALAAISGTTPPNSLCSSIWLETTFESISPFPLELSLTTDAAV